VVFEGSAVALVTPFKENGEVNFFSLKKLIEFQIACGTKAIVILGTTGESATISSDERTKIIKFCSCLISKRVKLIVGTGSNSTKTAIKLSLEAENLGADAVLTVTPYYNKCNQNGLFEHYKMIANSINIPVIIYNVPSRTGVNILPETVLKLSKIKNIVGIKEASGNLSQIAKLFDILPANFAIYSGDDLLTLPIMLLGGKGVISVTANCYPELVQNMCEFALKNDYFNAKRISRYLYKINTALFLDVNPICVKFYMNLLGFNVGSVRLPLTSPSAEISKILKEVKNDYES
jgi:4-hydroxy-tetrahydrodipicolinate synthase